MQKNWERQHRCRAKVTRGATSRNARSKKRGDNQSQAAEHRSHEDPLSHSKRKKNWEDTTKLQRTDACKSTSHGERCKCTGITHHKNKKIVLNSIPSKNAILISLTNDRKPQLNQSVQVRQINPNNRPPPPPPHLHLPSHHPRSHPLHPPPHPHPSSSPPHHHSPPPPPPPPHTPLAADTSLCAGPETHVAPREQTTAWDTAGASCGGVRAAGWSSHGRLRGCPGASPLHAVARGPHGGPGGRRAVQILLQMA